MSEASHGKAVEDQRDAEKRAVEGLQAEYKQALDKLRTILQREVILKELWAELDGDAHPFE